MDKPKLSEVEKLNATIARLRGQLQNCVNHLEWAKRGIDTTRIVDRAIEQANKALYETL